MLLMSPKQLETYLLLLARRLEEAEVPATFYLIGGAAMSIGYMPERRLTTDIDAKVKNFEQLKPYVAAVARDYGLAEDWLNTSASKLISQMASDQDWILWESTGTVEIYFASAELLLAMKLAASRPAKDSADIKLLLGKLEIRTVEQAEEIFEKYFPGDLLPAKALRLLSVLLSEVH